MPGVKFEGHVFFWVSNTKLRRPPSPSHHIYIQWVPPWGWQVYLPSMQCMIWSFCKHWFPPWWRQSLYKLGVVSKPQWVSLPKTQTDLSFSHTRVMMQGHVAATHGGHVYAMWLCRCYTYPSFTCPLPVTCVWKTYDFVAGTLPASWPLMYGKL